MGAVLIGLSIQSKSRDISETPDLAGARANLLFVRADFLELCHISKEACVSKGKRSFWIQTETVQELGFRSLVHEKKSPLKFWPRS